MIVCVKGNGGRNARFAIKRFLFFDQGIGDLTDIWREKHGKPLKPRPQKRPKTFVVVPDGFKHCYGCESTLPHSEFSADRSRGDGFNNRCRDCAARRWKDANEQICDRCGGGCVGQTCARCLLVMRRVRDAEWDALAIVPNLIYEAQEPLRRFLSELASTGNLSPHKRLQMLLSRIENGN
jgi:hypothetical protein